MLLAHGRFFCHPWNYSHFDAHSWWVRTVSVRARERSPQGVANEPLRVRFISTLASLFVSSCEDCSWLNAQELAHPRITRSFMACGHFTLSLRAYFARPNDVVRLTADPASKWRPFSGYATDVLLYHGFWRCIHISMMFFWHFWKVGLTQLTRGFTCWCSRFNFVFFCRLWKSSHSNAKFWCVWTRFAFGRRSRPHTYCSFHHGFAYLLEDYAMTRLIQHDVWGGSLRSPERCRSFHRRLRIEMATFFGFYRL